jgi:hypothetical protein
MASSELDLISNLLSSHECSKIPEDIKKKIQSYIKNTTEENVVAKALLETTKVNLGKYLCLVAVICVVRHRLLQNSSG